MLRPIRVIIQLLVLLTTFGFARADEPPPPVPEAPAPETPQPAPEPAPPPTVTPAAPPISQVTGPTLVRGRVTDILGRPVANARVYVLSRIGERHTLKTDKDGVYSSKVDGSGTYGVVIAIDKAHVFRTVLVARGQTNMLDIEVELDTQGGEVIRIEDKKRPIPKVKPKPQKDPNLSLPYSEEAVERDAWARAWLLLDIDETGQVTRLKLLKKPGFDLDRIAIEEAFKLRFDPAKDKDGRPMKTYILWTMEWPSMDWLIQSGGTAIRRPNDVEALDVMASNIRTAGLDRANWARPDAAGTAFPRALSTVPCAGSGPLNLDLRNRAYRDCSEPDIRDAEALPWITRETAATAIAELSAPTLVLTEEPPKGSKVPPLVASGVTVGVAIAFVASYVQYQKAARNVADHQWKLTVDPVEYLKDVDERKKWSNLSIGFGAATIVGVGVSLFLWNRNQSPRSFSVQPTNNKGAALSYGGSF